MHSRICGTNVKVAPIGVDERCKNKQLALLVFILLSRRVESCSRLPITSTEEVRVVLLVSSDPFGQENVAFPTLPLLQSPDLLDFLFWYLYSV